MTTHWKSCSILSARTGTKAAEQLRIRPMPAPVALNSSNERPACKVMFLSILAMHAFFNKIRLDSGQVLSSLSIYPNICPNGVHWVHLNLVCKWLAANGAHFQSSVPLSSALYPFRMFIPTCYAGLAYDQQSRKILYVE